MGTSASVSGAGPGVPLVPDWIEDVPAEGASVVAPIPLTPKARLAAARREMGKFAIDGERSHMRRGVADYIRRGRGGAAMATRRSAGSASRGASLAGIVGGNSTFDVVRDRIRVAIASSGDPDSLLAAIAAAASPNDGTLDSETGQRAAAEALQHVLELNPDANLLNLGQSDRETLLERFLAIDCYELFMSEVGKHIQSKVDLATAAERINGIKDYFCETFRQANRARGENGSRSLGSASDREIAAVCRAVIAEAYFTFEVYLDEN